MPIEKPWRGMKSPGQPGEEQNQENHGVDDRQDAEGISSLVEGFPDARSPTVEQVEQYVDDHPGQSQEVCLFPADRAVE